MADTVQARDVIPGMWLDRLTHTENGRPAYVAGVVKIVHPAPYEGVTIIEWTTGEKLPYADYHRFIVKEPPF